MTNILGEGNGSVPKGGVLLGGRSVTLTLKPEDYAKLTVLAKLNNTGQTQMAEFIVSQGIGVGFAQAMMQKVMSVLTSWPVWATWK